MIERKENIKMKKICTICTVLALTMLTACSNGDEADTTAATTQATTVNEETTTKAEKKEYETLEEKDITSVGDLDSVYEAEDYKISLLKGWNQQESNGADLFTFEDKEVRIGITSSTLEKSGTLDECIDNLCMLYENFDYTITGIRDITINGLKGRVIEYKSEGDDSSSTGYQMVVNGVKTMFVITFVADTE